MKGYSGAFDNKDEIIPLAFGAVVGGALFGGLHCLAWNFQFPTSGEALAWKICSVLTTGLPTLSLAPLIAWLQVNTSYRSPYLVATVERPTIRFLVGMSLITILLTYILARLFLMVEIFRSLFFLPPEAFVDTWSGSFPHFTG
jgi:hypothetical protein